MAKYTRLAATITARYTPAVGAVDGFYLDGRLAGKREAEQADITLDREDRGFFYAIYASSHIDRRDDKDESQRHRSLEHILNDMKHNDEKNIDDEINDLADCAVNVSGRLTLGDDGVLQPYFAGVMVKDAEIAAVTMGRVCAYLYRNDILYPLTEDDFPIEPIDTNGRNVPNINIYSAGSAATIRYSNIAQLQGDDCIILCNKEVMETIGQRAMLDLLYEAEDAHIAAGMVMERMADENPDVPHQFFIAFVEDILDAEKSVRFQSYRQKPQTQPQIFDTTGKVPSLGNTGKQRTQPHAMGGSHGPAGGQGTGQTPVHDPYGYNQDEQGIYSDAYYPQDPQYQEPLYVTERETKGSGRKIAITILLVLILAIVAFLVANHYLHWVDIPGLTPGTTTTTTTTETTAEEETTTTTTTLPTTTTKPTTTKATTTAAPQPTHPDTYEIKPGDTLWNIAEEVYADYDPQPEDIQALVEQIQAANPDVIQGDMFQAGDVIKIPDPQYDYAPAE